MLARSARAPLSRPLSCALPALALAALACSSENLPGFEPNIAGQVGASGSSVTSGGSGGSAAVAGGGNAPAGGSASTGGSAAGGTAAGGSAAGGTTTGGAPAGGTGSGGAAGAAGSAGQDTPPWRPININAAAAANQPINFTAKQLDPMAGSSSTPTHDTDQQHGVVDTRKPKIQGKLVLTMGGIGGCCGQGGIGGFAVGLGFHEMAIAYQTAISSAPNQYKDALKTNPNDPEANRQMGDARMEAWDGKDRVDWLEINEHDSFAYRTVLALKHMQQQDPGGDWEYFLTQDKTGVRWSDVYLVGYSYGSQTLAVVSKYVRIGRGIATSGPANEEFPNATWIKEPSATPLERMFGLVGSNDLGNKVATMTSAGWLAPELVVNGNVTTAELGSSHVFVLQGDGHGEFCAGDGGKWKALCNYAFGVSP